MDDRRTAEGLEHLQAAANELVAAARSFLDVAEDVIADPDRFGGMAAGAVDMLKGFTGRGEQPWERHARDADEWEGGLADFEDSGSGSGSGEPGADSSGVEAPMVEKPEPEVKKPAPKPRSPKKSSASRVKRIVVD
ncbi:MAG: hypothetical protein WBA45_03465 [Microthrixaceae bacterium]